MSNLAAIEFRREHITNEELAGERIAKYGPYKHFAPAFDDGGNLERWIRVGFAEGSQLIKRIAKVEDGFEFIR